MRQDWRFEKRSMRWNQSVKTGCLVLAVLRRLALTLVLIGAAGQTLANEPFRVTIGFGPPVSDFCRAVVTEAFRRLGRRAIVTNVPAERAIQLANDGIDDAECMRIDGIERMYPNLVQVPEKFFDVKFAAFVRKGRNLEPGWAALKPYNVGALYGWKLIEMKVSEVGPKSFVRVGNADSLFHMLNLGRIDVATLNLLDGRLKLKQLGLESIVAVEPPLAAVPLFFSMHKRHAGLIEPLTQVFRDMKADGSWDSIQTSTLPTVGD